MSQVSQRSGLSLTTISFVERELRSPTLHTLLRISGVLQTDLGALIHDAASK